MPDIHSECNNRYNELLLKLSAADAENKKLARELRALEKRFEISKLNITTQSNVNKGILIEKRMKEMYLHMLLETCPDLIFMFDKDLEFQLGSKSIEEHLGISDVSLLQGRSLNSIIERYQPLMFTETVIELMKKTVSSGGVEKPNDYIDIEANTHIYRGNILPFFQSENENEFIGIFFIMTDVTDIAKKEMAERASRSKSNFLARMSHEIRTPLSAMMGMAELSLREDLPAAAVEFVSTIVQAGENLLDIINDILDLSKIETGQLEIIQTEYMITSLINDVINIIKPKTLASKLRFIVDIDCKMPCSFRGDVIRIRQTIINLLSNAVKYTEKGFVHFSIRTEYIDDNNVNMVIKVQDSGRGIKKEDISLIFDEYTRFDMSANKDSIGTGLGLAITHTLVTEMGGEINVVSEFGAGSVFTAIIPQEVISREELAKVENPESHNVLIFERREILIDPIIHTMNDLGVRYKLVSTDEEFYEELVSNQYSFVFLAAILYDKVKTKYESIETNSTIVLVAEFGDVIPTRNIHVLTTPIFSIPCANIFNGVTDNYTKSSSDKSSIEFTAPDAKVLIVDDINTNLIIAKGLIEPYGMHVDTCTSGSEAINAITSTRYDLIFMDHMMPEMDGVETTKRIRDMEDPDSYYKNVPVIALTANSILCSQDMFMTSGFSDFLSKPIETLKLNNILKKWIPVHMRVDCEAPPRTISGGTDTADSISAGNSAGSDAVLDKIEGIDVEKGVRMTGGTIEFFYETLASYSSDIVERFDLIRECIDTKDLKRYTTYVHAIRSASANIGADYVSELAFDLENAGINGDWEYILSHNGIFTTELEKLQQNIKTALSAYDDNEDGENGVDRENAIKKELGELTSALDVYDIVAVNDTVNNLLKLARTENEKRTIREISNHILLFEYDKVYALINSFTVRI